jgi:hypothetical protein
MTAICDSLLCGRPAGRRVAGRVYCDRHAEAFVASVNSKAGRRIVRPTPILSSPVVTA